MSLPGIPKFYFLPVLWEEGAGLGVLDLQRGLALFSASQRRATTNMATSRRL
jgi:hypothetical protein